MTNQNPEQIARDKIDMQLAACGWIVQDVKKINLNAGVGIAVRNTLLMLALQIMFYLLMGNPAE